MNPREFRAGVVVNPVAGCGISLGLKGSDLLRAVDCRKSISVEYAARFLSEVDLQNIHYLTVAGPMGEEAFRKAGLSNYEIIYSPGDITTSHDTAEFVRLSNSRHIQLLIFFGGDGTARSVFDGSPMMPALGIPTGSKMFSSVFARNIESGVQILRELAGGGSLETMSAEVIDLDEDEYSAGHISTRFYGELTVPRSRLVVSESKAEYNDDYVVDAAEYVVEHLEDNVNYLVGPGSTCKKILESLGQHGSLLGFDLLFNREVKETDLGEDRLYALADSETRLVISPIGGQGFLLGRGNRQLSARVLKKLNIANILVVASPQKVQNLSTLYVDLQNDEISFPGYVKVLYGYGKFRIFRVENHP